MFPVRVLICRVPPTRDNSLCHFPYGLHCSLAIQAFDIQTRLGRMTQNFVQSLSLRLMFVENCVRSTGLLQQKASDGLGSAKILLMAWVRLYSFVNNSKVRLSLHAVLPFCSNLAGSTDFLKRAPDMFAWNEFLGLPLIMVCEVRRDSYMLQASRPQRGGQKHGGA